MKKNNLYFGIFSIAALSIICSSFALMSINKSTLYVSNAATRQYTLKCTDFASFVTNKYLTTANGNKIKFDVSGCSGNNMNPDGYFRNYTIFHYIKNVTINYTRTKLGDAICYYTNDPINFVTGGCQNYVLRSGIACSDLGSSYIKITNSALTNNNDILTVSSFTITYIC